MKRLKFFDPLPELILSGQKTITWRVNDEKNIQHGDELSLCNRDGIEFAKAVVISVNENTFGNLSKEDKEGHENFANNEEMYKTYSRYYKMEIAPETKLKIIKFKLA